MIPFSKMAAALTLGLLLTTGAACSSAGSTSSSSGSAWSGAAEQNFKTSLIASYEHSSVGLTPSDDFVNCALSIVEARWPDPALADQASGAAASSLMTTIARQCGYGQ